MGKRATTPGGFLFNAISDTSQLHSGDRVRHPYGHKDRVGVLLGYSIPHEYAIVRFDDEDGEVLLHPESLESEE